MAKFCMKCGAEVQENFKVCPKCGNMIQAGPPVQPPPTTPQPQQQPPMQQQTGYNNMQTTQPYAGGYPGSAAGGSNKKLLLAIVAIVAVIVVVLVVVFVFMGGGQDSRFIGEWEYSYSGMTVTYDFKSNGDLEVMGMNVAKWSVSGDQLCLELSDEWSSMMPVGEDTNGCTDYEFSDGGDTLTIQALGGGATTVLTRK